MTETTGSGGKVLVTGGGGHLGANLVRRLLADGHDVRVLVLPGANNTALDGLDLERVEGDIRDAESASRAVKGCDRVFHVAAKISTFNATPEEEREIFEINVTGTRHMLRAAMDHGVSRFVLTGSFSATGYDPDDPSLPADETVPFYPFEDWLPYTRSKVLAEHEVHRAVHEGLDARIATSCAILGPNDYLPSRLGRTLCEFANGELRAYINGGFEFVAARDIVEGHVLTMEKGRPGQKYIFASHFMTMDDLFDLYEEVTGARRPRKLPVGLVKRVTSVYYGVFARYFPSMPQRLTPAAIKILSMYRHADTSKARTELGFVPTDLLDAVREQYEFFCARGKIRAPRALGSRGVDARAATRAQS